MTYEERADLIIAIMSEAVGAPPDPVTLPKLRQCFVDILKVIDPR